MTKEIKMIIYGLGLLPPVIGFLMGSLIALVDPSSFHEILALRGPSLLRTAAGIGGIWGIFIGAGQMLVVTLVCIIRSLQSRKASA